MNGTDADNAHDEECVKFPVGYHIRPLAFRAHEATSPEHDGLDAILRPPGKHAEEVDTEQPRHFCRASHEIKLAHYCETRLLKGAEYSCDEFGEMRYGLRHQRWRHLYG